MSNLALHAAQGAARRSEENTSYVMKALVVLACTVAAAVFMIFHFSAWAVVGGAVLLSVAAYGVYDMIRDYRQQKQTTAYIAEPDSDSE